ncbi:4-(cytidine 5'-diphospho)-2-C-methyl-D-erythritol kinase [Pseudodesulfovibrio indicus]|uniref:4-(cytidine 5'-diphospho)-2-C-methyl-D-erythritol kinase n=1 Tax=Pseudodesulfovibrio indicus TaxID=1716143 RepID=UPI002930F348|nr:4-(cytidine 5'-diphospho)-2-C-methyl-D-erythritol kinase [Pseudodesulfovibrio indicus]
MERATLIAPAKINLHLRIVGLRDDGYHELETLFHPVAEPCDLLEIEPAPDGGFELQCPGNPELETDSNLIRKAWLAFGEATGFRPGLRITLTKRIPMGGGLGGGSSDAAALLRFLNREAGDKALDEDALNALAAGLGADVPFFLQDGPAWATGIGEKLVPAAVDLSGATLVIVCPDVHVNTAWAFRTWDEKYAAANVHDSLTSARWNTKNPSPVSARDMANDFEPVVFEEFPTLGEIKEKLLSLGAEKAAMSGSGASLFGVFRDRGSAMSAVRALESMGLEIFQVDCP